MENTRVLIVDDEEGFGKMLKINLEDTGKYVVRFESHGANSLKAAEEFKPHIVLMDIMMRDMAGPMAARKIRSHRDFKKLPIVFLTAITSQKEGEAEPGDISGFPAISKPIEMDALTALIEKHTRK